MKKIIITTILLLAAFSSALRAQQSQRADTTEAKYIAEQLMDSASLYGIFESAPLEGRLHLLKSGITPELQDGYLPVMIKCMLTKFNTITPIKGNFDSLIYIKTPSFESDAELPIQFFPYPSTKWFLILHTPYDVFGQPKPEWIIRLDKPKVKSYLNPNTVFETTSNYQGNVCFNWDKTFQQPYGLKVYSDDVMNDIIVITSVLKDKPGSDRTSKFQALRATLKSPLGKAIVSYLK